MKNSFGILPENRPMPKQKFAEDTFRTKENRSMPPTSMIYQRPPFVIVFTLLPWCRESLSAYWRRAETPLSVQGIPVRLLAGNPVNISASHDSPPDCRTNALSGHSESNRDYLLPKQAYYHYTMPRHRIRPQSRRPPHDSALAEFYGVLPLYYAPYDPM